MAEYVLLREETPGAFRYVETVDAVSPASAVRQVTGRADDTYGEDDPPVVFVAVPIRNWSEVNAQVLVAKPTFRVAEADDTLALRRARITVHEQRSPGGDDA
jgi:hypothetical protein